MKNRLARNNTTILTKHYVFIKISWNYFNTKTHELIFGYWILTKLTKLLYDNVRFSEPTEFADTSVVIQLKKYIYTNSIVSYTDSNTIFSRFLSDWRQWCSLRYRDFFAVRRGRAAGENRSEGRSCGHCKKFASRTFLLSSSACVSPCARPTPQMSSSRSPSPLGNDIIRLRVLNYPCVRSCNTQRTSFVCQTRRLRTFFCCCDNNNHIL